MSTNCCACGSGPSRACCHQGPCIYCAEHDPNSTRALLAQRYQDMPNTAWFKAAHEGRSLGEGKKIR